jgi:hypothetical protein
MKMNKLESPQSRMLIAVGVLVLTVLACGVAAPAKAPPTAVRVRHTPGPNETVPPRVIPTLVATYTRMPTLTATATPMPTRTRTPTAIPTKTPPRAPTATTQPLVVAVPKPGGFGMYVPPGQPTEGPCPAPDQIPAIKGKIIFFTDRETAPETPDTPMTSLYMMDPDGSNQKPAGISASCAMSVTAFFQNRMVTFNDGAYRLYTESLGKGGTGTSIFLRDSVGKLVRRVTTYDGVNYDTALAPDQGRIAFVSEVDMNDEIYTINIDGTKGRRLTFNTWEWDKHPSWSVDGKYIVFWSNRQTMRQQIWLMHDNGDLQHNISNNNFNDWDPIWIYP